MSNYIQSTNFATKDALPSGDPLKIVRGTEINTEFNNIATAVATKADLVSPILVTPALGTPVSGNLTNCTFPTLNQNTTGNAATATALQNARTINEVSFNGTANITLPTVNTSGDQTVSGIKTFSVDTFVNGLRVGRGAGNISTNAAVGLDALAANTTGFFNVANGFQALQSNTEGFLNTATGASALLFNTTGSENTANGVAALRFNTTGSNNTANGFEALLNNTTGILNTANGYRALLNNTTGIDNTANGREALSSNTTGSNNTANGSRALFSNTTGSNNTGVGLNANASSATVSNTITLGNASIIALRCQVTTITSLSDARDKNNIVDIPAGLSFVQALRPVSFDWNMRDGAKVGVPEFGFIAQELQAVQADTGITVPNLVYDDNPEKLEASASTLIPVLVKAIQELKEEFDAYVATHP